MRGFIVGSVTSGIAMLYAKWAGVPTWHAIALVGLGGLSMGLLDLLIMRRNK